MSDGRDTLADRRWVSSADDGDDRFARPAQRPPGAAPWERFAGARRRSQTTAPNRTEEEHPGAAGCHTTGELTVADLIAKLGGPVAGQPRHRRAAPDAEPRHAEPLGLGSRGPSGLDDPQRTDRVITPSPFSADAVSEPTDLDPAEDPDDPEGDGESGRTVVLPAAVRAAPVRIRASIAQKPPPEPEAGPRRRPMLLAGRLIAAMFAVSALALTGGAWQWSTSKNNRLNTVVALDPQSHDIVDPGAQFGDENFLIVGVDSRAGANSQMGAGDTEETGGSRSDTVMLVNIPASRKRVVAVSFPRDLAITPTRCEAWNPDTGAYGPLYDADTGKYGPRYVYTETKLNSAYAFGGPKCLVKVIQKLSGLSINRFIAIDFVGFAKMVDALGGVEVCTPTPLKDYKLGTVLAHSGRQVIDGQTALNYVRARSVTTEDNGDYGRIKRQQLFLSSLLRSLISKNTFSSLTKLNNVVNMFISESYVDNVKTKDLVDLGQSMQGVTAGHITFVTVPTGETDENGNEPPRTADMRALFDAIINDDPLPKEPKEPKEPKGHDQNTQTLGAAPTGSAPTGKPTVGTPPGRSTERAESPEQLQAVTTAPQDVTVQVSNSTGRSGLATTATNELARRGFKVLAPDDYPSPLKSTTVFFSPGNEQAAVTVASTLANPKIERATGSGSVVQVVLGPDFSSIAAPAPSGSSVRVLIDRNPDSTPAKLPEDLTVTNAADTSCK
ncbi:MAG: LCP family protein [Mycobacterium sp.]|uniref:LCP family glycopolymer transferase n=1 Tax=Mycobacterium sp. TaxID=1785 RepID=UPI002634E9A3|nr:LCP family protein [Mycobacterium sp.]MDI3313669.1 LCP family protein [Mycobacterium sp.]